MSPYTDNLQNFPPEKVTREKSVFIIIYFTSVHFYRIKVLNSHLQADVLYTG